MKEALIFTGKGGGIPVTELSFAEKQARADAEEQRQREDGASHSERDVPHLDDPAAGGAPPGVDIGHIAVRQQPWQGNLTASKNERVSVVPAAPKRPWQMPLSATKR